MKKNHITVTILLVLCMLMISATAFAKGTDYYYGSDGYHALNDRNRSVKKRVITKKIDLNKDGKKETVKIAWQDKDNQITGKLFVDNRCLLKNVDRIYIIDVDRRDKKVEIIARKVGNFRKEYIYHYKSKKLVKYATLKENYGMKTPLDTCLFGRGYFKEWFNGKGKIYVPLMIVVKDGDGTVIGNAIVPFIMKKNKVFFDYSETVKVAPGIGWEQYARRSMAFFKGTSAASGIAFTLSPGDKFIFKKAKFGKQYTYLYFQDLNTKQCGWQRMNTKDLLLLEKL